MGYKIERYGKVELNLGISLALTHNNNINNIVSPEAIDRKYWPWLLISVIPIIDTPDSGQRV